MKIKEINGIKFIINGNKVVVADCDKNTKIKYTIRCSVYDTSVYYDLISIYNFKENWLVNIPVPIFVKEIGTYTNDENTKIILQELHKKLCKAKDEYEASEIDKDFWKEICVGDIDFLRLFILNIDNQNPYCSLEEYKEEDEHSLNCYLYRDELDDIRQEINKNKNKLFFQEHKKEFIEKDLLPGDGVYFYENLLNTTLEKDGKVSLIEYHFYHDFCVFEQYIHVYVDEETDELNYTDSDYRVITLEEFLEAYKDCEKNNSFYKKEKGEYEF